MVSRGQPATPTKTSAIASCGEGGSCGHQKCTSGRCSASQRPTNCALVDIGDDRKPCRYSTWVVGPLLIGAPRPTGTSADPPRGCGPAWERPCTRPADGAPRP